jgi:hypothetical protein
MTRQRLVQKLTWKLAGVLTKCPQSPNVVWWTAALLRFSTTGQPVIAVEQVKGPGRERVTVHSNGLGGDQEHRTYAKRLTRAHMLADVERRRN